MDQPLIFYNNTTEGRCMENMEAPEYNHTETQEYNQTRAKEDNNTIAAGQGQIKATQDVQIKATQDVQIKDEEKTQIEAYKQNQIEEDKEEYIEDRYSPELNNILTEFHSYRGMDCPFMIMDQDKVSDLINNNEESKAVELIKIAVKRCKELIILEDKLGIAFSNIAAVSSSYGITINMDEINKNYDDLEYEAALEGIENKIKEYVQNEANQIINNDD